MTVEHNFCVLRARGPWNKENLKRFLKSLNEFDIEPQTQDWGTLAILYGESLLTPDAMVMFTNAHLNLAQSGLKHVAVVLSDVNAKTLVKHQFSHVYQQCDINHEYFDDEQSALNWLSENGVNINPTLLLRQPKEKFW